MNKITFEKACEMTGKDALLLPGVEGLTEIASKRLIAGYKLDTIEEAINLKDKFVPDFDNYNQLKYTGWLVWSASAGGFVYTRTHCTVTHTSLGARFWFKDGNTARKFFEDNTELVNDLHRRG